MADPNALSELIERHCTTIQKLFSDFRFHYIAHTIGEPPSQDALTALHTLKGSCGSIGFTDLHRKVASLHNTSRTGRGTRRPDAATNAPWPAKSRKPRCRWNRCAPRTPRHTCRVF
ncbi:Hpt domain-containing protein [Breoghania sp.]|uniref:Hpt domain-containing protein n=1 Tax=Breoghania sp. TaxID=2065378 RepID=UPI00260324D5|nr:Hpt domain-containing protein [Breoghania sp.]MDJ0933283.1 Hpt domain-containing protein [Breoghania sp.]